MARPRREDRELVKHMRVTAERSTSVEELRAAQAILLPAQTGATLVQTEVLIKEAPGRTLTDSRVRGNLTTNGCFAAISSLVASY